MNDNKLGGTVGILKARATWVGDLQAEGMTGRNVMDFSKDKCEILRERRMSWYSNKCGVYWQKSSFLGKSLGMLVG